MASSVLQLDAGAAASIVPNAVVCTDPPYYDNVAYADLADFFYVWRRRSLAHIYPDLFSDAADSEDAGTGREPYRFGGSQREAETYFEQGLRQVFQRVRELKIRITRSHFSMPSSRPKLRTEPRHRLDGTRC